MSELRARASLRSSRPATHGIGAATVDRRYRIEAPALSLGRQFCLAQSEASANAYEPARLKYLRVDAEPLPGVAAVQFAARTPAKASACQFPIGRPRPCRRRRPGPLVAAD